MEINELKQKIRQTLTQNPDKKITPAELEDVMIDMVDNQPSQESVIEKELFFDDGSGEVVPVKHPDLSTQPSILSYKFAGNYVYEQMVWVDGEKFKDNHIDEIDLIKFQDYRLDIKSTVLIDYHIFIVGDKYKGNYSPLPWPLDFCFNIASNDKRIFFKRFGSSSSFTFKGVWVRVVWTSEPKSGGYYYDYNAPEPKYNFHIKGFEGLSFSIDGEPIDDSVKLSDNIVERFISGVDISIDAGGESVVMVECTETSESADKTSSRIFSITFRYDGNNRILSLPYSFPRAAERIKKGEKVTLIFKRV